MNEIPDIPRLYTAFAEWASCMLFIIFLAKRYKGAKLYLTMGTALVVMGAFQYMLGLLPLPYWIPGMIAAVMLMYGFILLTCKVSPIVAGCWCVQAFIIAEFAASIEWQIYYYLAVNFALMQKLVMSVLFFAGFMLALYAGLIVLERRYYKETSKALDFRAKDFVTFLITGVVVFVVSNVSFFAPNSFISGKYPGEIYYIRTLVDLCGMIMFYSYREQKLWLYAKSELNALQNVFTRQYEHYCQSKESIEMINRKYHDIKHQIEIIRQEENPNKRAEYLDNMEKGIKLYEAQNKTGNAVLDTILTGKSVTCLEREINFTCVADGSHLDFMDVMDICSIFGNALDNAIESVSTLKQADKRIIKLAVHSQNNFLIINVDNYNENKLLFENGFLTTTKANKNNHGYGIKSIKYAAEKYNGNMSITTKDNWFNLCVVIPI